MRSHLLRSLPMERSAIDVSLSATQVDAKTIASQCWRNDLTCECGQMSSVRVGSSPTLYHRRMPFLAGMPSSVVAMMARASHALS